jgi:hypothetical protein
MPWRDVLDWRWTTGQKQMRHAFGQIAGDPFW